MMLVGNMGSKRTVISPYLASEELPNIQAQRDERRGESQRQNAGSDG